VCCYFHYCKAALKTSTRNVLIEFIFTDVIDKQKKTDYKRSAGVRESPKRIKLEINTRILEQTDGVYHGQ
jgi:hypothetical protein